MKIVDSVENKQTNNTIVDDGIELISIEDNKHNTNRISINLCMNINEKDVSANAILPFLLTHATKKYPTTVSFERHLSKLYGASLHADIRKLGKIQILSISISAIDSRFSLENENLLKECVDVLKEVLFNPFIDKSGFNEDYIKQEKRCLVELIESELNEKRVYALNKCQQIMFEGTALAIGKYGTIEKVNALTNKDIYEAWQNVLEKSKVYIMMVGSNDAAPVISEFKNEFSKIKRNKIEIDNQIEIQRKSKINEITERINVNQAKLVLGFNIEKKDENTFPETVMTALFGGTPHSRLFLNVREKKSLCYYCAATFDRNKRMMLVDSGLEEKNKNEAVSEILKQLEFLKNGEFTDEELSFAKLNLINSFKTATDYQSSLEGYYISQITNKEIISLLEAAKKINEVTKYEIIEAANRVTLDTIYLLSGEVEEDI